MHDIKQIRQNPAAFDEAMAKRGLPPQADALLKLDEQRRADISTLEALQAERNAVAKQIGLAKRNGEDASDVMGVAGNLKSEITMLEDSLENRNSLLEILEVLPNILDDEVPEGNEEADNIELLKWGKLPEIPDAKQHFEIGEALGLMDFETAAKMSGSRFVLLKGALARMERALASFMLDTHTQEFGFEECAPPVLVRGSALYGTGQLPKFSEDIYNITSLEPSSKLIENFINEKLQFEVEESHYFLESEAERTEAALSMLFKNSISHYLIPTAEVSLTNIVADTILDESALPQRFTAYTPCFRSEAGSAGRDTRGMIRQHQFSKVELVSIVKAEDAQAEHERMTQAAETVLQKLELPYRKMLLCNGDTGFSAQKTYDLEVWLPGQNAYREISSISHCGEFQARRMKARFKREGEKHTEFVHTLNGSGLAVGRTMVAILENYQQPDGSVEIPKALQPYMGGLERIVA